MHILLYSPADWPIDDALLDPQLNRIERLQGGWKELGQCVSARQPDLLMVTGYEASAAYLRELQTLSASLPQTTVAVYQPQVSAEQLMEMMRAGVRDVLTDCHPATVAQLLERAVLRRQTSPAARSRLVGVVSAKGGDGGSCATANLAYAIAHQAKARVLLMDLSLPFGQLEMFLIHQSGMKDLADLSAEADRMDGSLLESMVHHVTPNLDLVVSPSSFDKVMRVQPQQVQQLLDIVRVHYDYVILDLGSSLDPLVLSVMDQVDEVHLVATTTLPSIRRGTQILHLLKSMDCADNMLSVVVNRFDKQGAVSLTEMERVMAKPVLCHLPVETDGIDNSLLKGRALMELMPASRYAQAVNGWASHITGIQIARKSIWQRLKTR